LQKYFILKIQIIKVFFDYVIHSQCYDSTMLYLLDFTVLRNAHEEGNGTTYMNFLVKVGAPIASTKLEPVTWVRFPGHGVYRRSATETQIYPFLLHDAMLAWYMLSSCVCVCLCHILKRTQVNPLCLPRNLIL